MNIFDGPCPEKRVHVPMCLLQVPVRSPQGAARYQVWQHAFARQRLRGTLQEVEKAHYVLLKSISQSISKNTMHWVIYSIYRSFNSELFLF